MSSVTRILSDIESGDPSAAEQLLPLVYQESREPTAAKAASRMEMPNQLPVMSTGSNVGHRLFTQSGRAAAKFELPLGPPNPFPLVAGICARKQHFHR